MNKTIFIDIDGTLIKQKQNLSNVMLEKIEVLPGVIECFNRWNWKGYKIILITGRKESSREITEKSLRESGLFWDSLLMGLDVGGQRIIINDSINPEEKQTCIAITVERDRGLENYLNEL